ncbi:MAG: cupin domain-containing protein [Thermodesulfobacteriota bacterium]|nr:cupin domain-containing protein [Thermodesulfobacteriota bacterium]
MESWTQNVRLSFMETDLKSGFWKIHHFRRSYPRNVYELTAHASILKPGGIPHEPHTHAEEELIVILAGSVEIITPDWEMKPAPSAPMGPGSIVYHDSNRAHTIHSVGSQPAVYVCLKWTGKRARKRVRPLQPSLFFPEYETMKNSNPFQTKTIFESPTDFLTNLHCHMSLLQPGAGYDPHKDAHDVLIIVLDGEVETLGQRVGPKGIIFYRAGEPHGMKNVGDIRARYVVFEFHRQGKVFKGFWKLARLARVLARKIR